MLATLIPIFDNKTSVASYLVDAEKKEMFVNPLQQGTASLDGAGNVAEFEIVNSMGVTGIGKNVKVFVPVNRIALYTELREQCEVPYKRIVLLIDNTIEPNEENLARLAELKKQGFGLAVTKVTVREFAAYQAVFRMCDTFLFDYREVSMKSARLFFGQYFPNIDLCAVNIDSQEEFEELTQGEEGGKTDYYEGDFFRVPIEESQTQLAPMKVTYINLLNVINAPDYDLTEAAKVIEKDPALVISLLEIVNRMSVNSEITSVKHAAAMLGQKELKKWINTAVTKELCSDKPSEIMRLSMIRAKYCENLAPLFDQAVLAPELFLMGLFSFLDIMVEKTMEEALKMITVSKNVENALLKGEGPLAPILEFVKAYENADWTESSRLLLLNSLKSDEVYRPYLEALSWYRDIFPEK